MKPLIAGAIVLALVLGGLVLLTTGVDTNNAPTPSAAPVSNGINLN